MIKKSPHSAGLLRYEIAVSARRRMDPAPSADFAFASPFAAPNDAHNCTPSPSIPPRYGGGKSPHFQLRFASPERATLPTPSP